LALQLPAPVQMHYSVRATDAQGTVREGSGVLTWRHDGQRYDLRLDVSASGQSLLSQTSRGRIGAAGLEPERFSDRRQRRSEQAVHFQRERSLISFSNNSAETALNEGAQDRLSVLVQLAGLLAGQSSSGPIPDQLSLPVASLSEAEVWTFQSEGLKPASPADGGTPLEARLLIRAERRAFDDRVEIWLAPSIGHWPVRIRMVQGGGAGFDLIWKP
jgi:hypothetical protein